MAKSDKLIAKKNCYLLTIYDQQMQNRQHKNRKKLSDVSGFNYIQLININEING